MALRATKPDGTGAAKRLKMFLYGEFGAGKTCAAIQFPNSYLIDCEKGMDNYAADILESKSVVFKTQEIDEVLEEIKALGTEKHEYQTIVIDPITKVEELLMERLNRQYNGDMRMWRDRDLYLRHMSNMLLRLDMNVIVTAHGKYDYGENMVKLGTTFDCWKRWPYTFDLVVEIVLRGQRRMALVKKSRMPDRFQHGEEFEWSYQELTGRFGAPEDTIATDDQVLALANLCDRFGVSAETAQKWIDFENVDAFSSMSSSVINKYINAVTYKLEQREQSNAIQPR